MNDNLGSPLCLEKTAHFFNPGKLILKKLRPLKEELSKPEFEIPTFSRKISQQEIFNFDQVVAQELTKYSSQPNILAPNWNVNNISQLKPINVRDFFQQQKPQTLLNIQKRMLYPKSQANSRSVLDNTFSPEKQKRNIKVVLNPFNEHGHKIILRRQDSRKSNNSTNSSCSLRPSKSQGKGFLQRKAQVKVLNRLFSSRSQHIE